MELIRDKIKTDTYMCKKLSDMIARGELRDDHPQQRKSGQWCNETRDNFVVTVIKNEDFDSIKICEQLTEEGVVLWLIDGLQRSTTIENYKAGRFALGKNIDPFYIKYQEAVKDKEGKIVYKNVTYDLRGKSYADLPEKLKEDFDNCPVSIVKHLDCTDEEIGRHIVRYNSGRPMVAAQKIIAYMFNAAKYIKKLSGHDFFNDCANLSQSSDKNGTVDKIVSEAIMGLNFFDSWNKEAKKVGKFLNENATYEMYNNFKEMLDRLVEVVTPQTGNLFTPKNSLLFFMLFDKFSKSGLTDNKYQEFLENFEELKRKKVKVPHEYILDKEKGGSTDFVSFVELDVYKSTKDKGIIEDKLHVLECIMNDFLHICSDTTEIKKYTSKEIIMECVNKNATDEDVELYEMVTNEISEVIENIDSKFLSEENRSSFVAIVAYSCINDTNEILRKWLPGFEESWKYDSDQKKNYFRMKINFDEYIKIHASDT